MEILSILQEPFWVHSASLPLTILSSSFSSDSQNGSW
jgi:hypothetical protein